MTRGPTPANSQRSLTRHGLRIQPLSRDLAGGISHKPRAVHIAWCGASPVLKHRGLFPSMPSSTRPPAALYLQGRALITASESNGSRPRYTGRSACQARPPGASGSSHRAVTLPIAPARSSDASTVLDCGQERMSAPASSMTGARWSRGRERWPAPQAPFGIDTGGRDERHQRVSFDRAGRKDVAPNPRRR